MDSFKEKVRYFFLPAVLFFGVLLVGALIFWMTADDPVIPPKLKSPPIQSKSPSESINTDKLKSPPTPSNNTNGNSLSIALFSVLLILLAVSILTNVLFFKWRFRANDKQKSFVPEVLIDNVNSITNGLVKRLKHMEEQHTANIDQSKRASKDTKKLFADLMEAFTVLQTTLDDRDKEIKRLKKGYDSEIFRNFLNRFIRVDYAICDEINATASENGKDVKGFQDIQDLLRDALDECGVSTFSPKLGENVRNTFGVADNYKPIPAKTKEEEFTIAEVIEPGFKLSTPEGEECIRPAMVKVFVPRKEN